MEVLVMFGVPAVSAALAGWLAYLAGRAKAYPALWGLGGLWLVLTTLLIVAINRATGWDGLGYVLVLIGIAAPSGVGLAFGGTLGFYRGHSNRPATAP